MIEKKLRAYLPYITATNCQWGYDKEANEKLPEDEKASTCINLWVWFVHFGEWTPFSANPTDIEPHGSELFERAVKGDFGEIAEYNPDPMSFMGRKPDWIPQGASY